MTNNPHTRGMWKQPLIQAAALLLSLCFCGGQGASADPLLNYLVKSTNERIEVTFEPSAPCVMQVQKSYATEPHTVNSTLHFLLPFYHMQPDLDQHNTLEMTHSFMNLAVRSKERAEVQGTEISEKFGDYLKFASRQAQALPQDFSNFNSASEKLNENSGITDPKRRLESVSRQLLAEIESGYFGRFVQQHYVEVFSYEGQPTYVVGPLIDWVLPTPDGGATIVQDVLSEHLDSHCTIEKLLETW